MRVLLDFVGMPALYNHHCFTFSTATLAELLREDVPGCFSCNSECKYRKCRYTVLLVSGLAPLISFTTHSLKSHIFSFSFDLVVILHKSIYELLINGIVVRASPSQSVDFGLIPFVESCRKTLKNDFHSSPAWRSAFWGVCGEHAGKFARCVLGQGT